MALRNTHGVRARLSEVGPFSRARTLQPLAKRVDVEHKESVAE